jgi:diguanylate cyclase (GGDEF)-like protein
MGRTLVNRGSGGPHARTAARQAAGLFAAAGLLAFVSAARPAGSDALIGIGIADLVVAVVIWLLPWERWPRGSSLLIAFPALVIIGVADRFGGPSPYTYALFFILLFVWIGVSQPPRSGLLVAAPALVAYMVPLTTVEHASVAAESAIVAIPVCVLIAEVLSRTITRLENADGASKRRADLLALLSDAGQKITSLSSDEVLDTVSRSVLRIGFDAAAINVIDDESQTFTVLHDRGLPEAYVAERHSLADGIPALVRRWNRTVVLSDYATHSQAIPCIAEAGFRLVIGAPVWVDGTIAAVLIGAGRAAGHPAPGEVEAVEILAGHAGRAFEVARHYEEQVRVAEEHAEASFVDVLTGTGNRRHANRLLDSLRPGDAAILVDLDHFKRVNDSIGHLGGDRVLVALGQYLRDHVRADDGIARYGGEEFVLVVRQAKDPQEIADRLVSGWAALRPLATLSAGVALHHEGNSPALTLAEADEALYTAKKTGRARAVVHPRSAA